MSWNQAVFWDPMQTQCEAAHGRVRTPQGGWYGGWCQRAKRFPSDVGDGPLAWGAARGSPFACSLAGIPAVYLFVVHGEGLFVCLFVSRCSSSP